jgi:xylulokinase
VLTSTSFLVQKLTGEVVMDRYSAANFGPLFDAGAQRWTDALAADIVALDRLPRLLWTTEIAGHVTKAAAAETGLAAGTPVTAGTIDAAAEAVSVGATRTGDMMLMYGSTIFVITQTAERLRDPALWYAPGLHPGGHAGMAGLATSGTLTHWFRDRFARELPRDTAFATLAAEAATSPPGANGLLLLPYFSGERTPIHDPHARGTFFGLNLTHSRGDLYRALVEGIAYGTRHVTDSFDAAGQRPARVLAVGGGVKNPLWLQATSDITGLDQSVCGNTLGAAYGDAFLAALSVGAVQPGDIADWNPVERQITASPNAIYDTRYSQFRRLYSQTRDIMAELGKVDP